MHFLVETAFSSKGNSVYIRKPQIISKYVELNVSRQELRWSVIRTLVIRKYSQIACFKFMCFTQQKMEPLKIFNPWQRADGSNCIFVSPTDQNVLSQVIALQ